MLNQNQREPPQSERGNTISPYPQPPQSIDLASRESNDIDFDNFIKKREKFV